MYVCDNYFLRVKLLQYSLASFICHFLSVPGQLVHIASKKIDNMGVR